MKLDSSHASDGDENGFTMSVRSYVRMGRYEFGSSSVRCILLCGVVQ